jgi:DNA-binding transcriptional LysR family regulator
MDLNDIVVFAKVVETRSFTGAAEALGLPKSTVSRKLAQLEERLGVRLVQRTTRKLALTDVGEAYYERCQRIVADVAAAEQLVTDMQATPRGQLKLTAPVDLSSRYLGSIVAEFIAAHPAIHVLIDASDRVADLIEEGFDVAIRFGPLPESTLIARRLCSIDFIMVAAPSYLARKGSPREVEELDDHERILFTPNSRAQTWSAHRGDASYEFGRPAHFSSNNISAVRDVVLAGGGIALIPEFIVACDIVTNTLVRVLPDWQGRSTDVHAVYPARQNLPPRLSLFLEHLAHAFSPPPWLRFGDGSPPQNAASSRA